MTICLALILSTLAIYAQMYRDGFVNLDDQLYVYENPYVQAGLTFASLKWALTAVVASNWML